MQELNVTKLQFPEIHLNSTITQSKKEEFIKRVQRKIALSSEGLQFFTLEESFFSVFLGMFTDYAIPFEDVDDIELNTYLRNKVMSYPIAQGLKECIEKQIIHKNPSKEAIKTFNYVLFRGLDAVNAACDVLDEVKNIINNNEIFEGFSGNKVNSILNILQNVVDNMAKSPDVESDIIQ